jgi:imidazolonepropionase-like amidohydrolase
MGVEAIYYRAFERAKEYMAEWEAYLQAERAGENPVPPRRDIRLDTLAEILRGEVHVHSHCYRADEILMLIRASQHFGFQIATLQHVLEGYKVAHEMAQAGVGGSTFGDWWGYKIEAYDAVPQNAAMMHDAGSVSSVNSDSDEMVRRMYGEAAKSVRYAGMDRVEALKLVTLNSAIQLGIEDRVGSIEVGKDADLALLNGDPLSSLSRVQWTMVDGEVEFERRDAFELDSNPPDISELEEEPRQVNPSKADLIALVNGRIHPVTSDVIENGTILIQGDTILAMGAEVAAPAGAWTYDLEGKDVWPGMISLGSSIGLHEIGAVSMTNDTSEIGGNQPDLRVSASLNADSAHIGVTRHNGVTRAQTTPAGRGPIRGQSSFIRLKGQTWEELLTIDRDMLHVRFPQTSNTAPEKDKQKTEAVDELRELFGEAREYGARRDAAGNNLLTRPSYDPRLEALLPYVRGEARVGLHASNAQTILFALKFAKDEELDAVLYGAKEAWKVVDALAQEQVPVVIGPVWTLPSSSLDPYDAAFANAAVLHRAGVPFAIMTQDEENERNLAFHAATAAAFGLPKEEAVRAVTYYPARILGVEDQFGSLAVGKRADIVVTDGHLLEITSPVTHLFIDGVFVDHNDDRQTMLYERYRERLDRLMQADESPK